MKLIDKHKAAPYNDEVEYYLMLSIHAYKTAKGPIGKEVQEMPSPKSKHSKSRRDKRRANWKLTVPGLVECPQCHAMKLPHHVCPVCGFYKGRSVIQAKTEE